MLSPQFPAQCTLRKQEQALLFLSHPPTSRYYVV
jgi:hypothetical protein